MRRRIFGVSTLLALSIFIATAASLPLTVKEIGLMLRTGYSSGAIMEDLAKRRCIDKLDVASETQLLQAGATPELIAALKSGTFGLSSQEMEQVKAESDAQAKRRALQAAADRKLNTLYRDQLAREREAGTGSGAEGDAISKFLKGDLVRYYNGSVVPADNEALGKKKLIAFYFSAEWCSPCRKFTPKLVDYYNRAASQHPEFEVVFFSCDKSSSAMESYMRQANMPWLAIDYQKLEQKKVLKTNAGDGIPSLVLVDSSGKVLSSSYVGGEYLGPQKVLSDLDAMFASGTIAPVASRE